MMDYGQDQYVYMTTSCNTWWDLREYFGVKTTAEFEEFWLSLTVDEKDYYRTVDLGC